MTGSKSSIIAQLQKEILPLQGYKRTANSTELDLNLGPLKNAFPNAQFPLGAVHEFCFASPENAAATTGFVSGIVASLMRNGAASVWISPSQTIFPPALHLFGIAPHQIIFIHLKKEKEIAWATEEALKCEGLAAVIAEVPELSFTASRRLQLAVEQSQVTGFLLRNNPRNLQTTACVTRWEISSLAGQLEEGMPGVGFPRWNVSLLKVRNGRPGTWQIESIAGRFRMVNPAPRYIIQEPKKKAV
jgi:protein ImuA